MLYYRVFGTWTLVCQVPILKVEFLHSLATKKTWYLVFEAKETKLVGEITSDNFSNYKLLAYMYVHLSNKLLSLRYSDLLCGESTPVNNCNGVLINHIHWNCPHALTTLFKAVG